MFWLGLIALVLALLLLRAVHARELAQRPSTREPVRTLTPRSRERRHSRARVLSPDACVRVAPEVVRAWIDTQCATPQESPLDAVVLYEYDAVVDHDADFDDAETAYERDRPFRARSKAKPEIHRDWERRRLEPRRTARRSSPRR